MAGLMLCAALGTQLLSLMEIIGPLVYLSAVFSGFALALLYPTLTTYLSLCCLRIPDMYSWGSSCPRMTSDSLSEDWRWGSLYR